MNFQMWDLSSGSPGMSLLDLIICSILQDSEDFEQYKRDMCSASLFKPCKKNKDCPKMQPCKMKCRMVMGARKCIPIRMASPSSRLRIMRIWK